ncbi:MAG: hypothetical protein KGI50_02615 [Patescibacteria group bacterium]|nr:hypothetical protein [Patescibacteria group bacterium]MDE2438595.1 hypothetical protein [Patescibacteria group bacterium]
MDRENYREGLKKVAKHYGMTAEELDTEINTHMGQLVPYLGSSCLSHTEWDAYATIPQSRRDHLNSCLFCQKTYECLILPNFKTTRETLALRLALVTLSVTRNIQSMEDLQNEKPVQPPPHGPCCEAMREVFDLDHDHCSEHPSRDTLTWARARHRAAQQCYCTKRSNYTPECLKEKELDWTLRLPKSREEHLRTCSFCGCYFEAILEERRGNSLLWLPLHLLQSLFVVAAFGWYAPHLERKARKHDERLARKQGISYEEYRTQRFTRMHLERREAIIAARKRLAQEEINEGAKTGQCNIRELSEYPHLTERSLAHIAGCNFCKRTIVQLPPV